MPNIYAMVHILNSEMVTYKIYTRSNNNNKYTEGKPESTISSHDKFLSF